MWRCAGMLGLVVTGCGAAEPIVTALQTDSAVREYQVELDSGELRLLDLGDGGAALELDNRRLSLVGRECDHYRVVITGGPSTSTSTVTASLMLARALCPGRSGFTWVARALWH